jgi:hypothetical protein
MKEIKSKLIGLACITMLSTSAYAQQANQAIDEPENTVAGEAHTHENMTGAGQMIFIDPKTGDVMSGQQQIDVSGSRKLQSTSVFGSGVASEPQLLEGGMIKIELNGQFIVPINVSVDKDGNIQKGHHIEIEKESK